MIKSFKYLLALSIVLLAFGCKSSKRIVESGELNEKLSAKQIIKQHEKGQLDFKTLQAKVKIEYTEVGKDKSQNYTLNLRLEKGKTIWLSATLGLARAKITPDKVQFYDKINNQFFDGNYALLSDFLGVELNYEKVENLLLGSSIFELDSKTYKASTHEKSYMLSPKDQDALFEVFLLLNPGHFKMDSQQIFQPREKRFLQVDYKSYQDVEKQILPETFEIIAVEDEDQVTIALEYKSVTLNSELRFPFRIPSGYKEIIIQ
ncbi:DUF4292 domain-containing protein [Winogradskyella sp. 3972H.M.0a.05]|uniref:DUF4292 domain-containing protein n=1 Tax=Winogradskyella sp. 3972H.M.0a.05 TaxID=2950277 RepID=UPI0033980F53